MNPDDLDILSADRMVDSQPDEPVPLRVKLHYVTNSVAELWDLLEVDPERSERIVDRVVDALSEI